MCEVQTVVEEGATGEFTGLGMADWAGGCSGSEARQSAQDGSGNCRAAVDVQFEDVFAG